MFHRSMSQELNVDINAAQLIDVVKDVIENDDDDDLDDKFINRNEVYLNNNLKNNESNDD